MHAGRQYPFHPTYWATEAWFWPSFVPWKLTAQRSSTDRYPWNAADLDTPKVSAPAVISSNRKVASFSIDVSSPMLPCYLTVAMDKFTVSGTDTARWRMTINFGGTVEYTAYKLQAFPQRNVLCDSWDFVLPDDLPGGTPLPNIVLIPATYADGGTPWPNY